MILDTLPLIMHRPITVIIDFSILREFRAKVYDLEAMRVEIIQMNRQILFLNDLKNSRVKFQKFRIQTKPLRSKFLI